MCCPRKAIVQILHGVIGYVSVWAGGVGEHIDHSGRVILTISASYTSLLGSINGPETQGNGSAEYNK